MNTPIELHLVLSVVIVLVTFLWPLDSKDQNVRKSDYIVKALVIMIIGSTLFILNWLWFLVQ